MPYIPSQQTSLSVEITRLGLLVESKEVRAVLDSNLLVYLRENERLHNNGAEEIDGFFRPDTFIQDLGRGGALGICYPTLYEILDPNKGERYKPAPPLNQAQKSEMYRRLEMLDRFNIKVLDVSQDVFRRALDIWFDARQGKMPPIPDPGFIDPIVAATALVNNLRLYSANVRHFAPFVTSYPINFVAVEVRKPGNYLRLTP